MSAFKVRPTCGTLFGLRRCWRVCGQRSGIGLAALLAVLCAIVWTRFAVAFAAVTAVTVT